MSDSKRKDSSSSSSSDDSHAPYHAAPKEHEHPWMNTPQLPPKEATEQPQSTTLPQETKEQPLIETQPTCPPPTYPLPQGPLTETYLAYPPPTYPQPQGPWSEHPPVGAPGYIPPPMKTCVDVSQEDDGYQSQQQHPQQQGPMIDLSREEGYPPNYYNPQPQTQQLVPNITVVTTQPPAAQPQHITFKKSPVLFTDANGNQVTTRLVYKSGTLTWTLFAILCCFCGLCIALIPFCVDGTKDVYHINPVNGTVVGVYKRRCC